MKTVGGGVVSHVIYEKDKPSYRSEIDQVMAAKPDFLYLNGYAPDTVVVLRDLWKANVDLPKFCQTYAVPQATLDANPPEVSEGIVTGTPSADVDSSAYKLAADRLGLKEVDGFQAQATDWASLAVLTIAKAGQAVEREKRRRLIPNDTAAFVTGQARTRLIRARRTSHSRSVTPRQYARSERVLP